MWPVFKNFSHASRAIFLSCPPIVKILATPLFTYTLFCRGADIEAEDVHSYTPLLTAAEYGQVEGFELLLNKGAMLVDREDPDVMVKSKDRKTVLFLAAEHNHPKIIEVHV